MAKNISHFSLHYMNFYSRFVLIKISKAFFARDVNIIYKVILSLSTRTSRWETLAFHIAAYFTSLCVCVRVCVRLCSYLRRNSLPSEADGVFEGWRRRLCSFLDGVWAYMSGKKVKEGEVNSSSGTRYILVFISQQFLSIISRSFIYFTWYTYLSILLSLITFSL